MSGPIFAQPDPRLSEIVEAICTSDVGPGAASSIALPVVSPIICFHYRQAPLLRLDDPISGAGGTWSDPGRFRITGVQTRAARLRPNGAVGVIIVRLKPESARRIKGLSIDELFGSAASLADLFPSRDISLLDEMLLEAGDPGARIAAVQSFLLSRLSERDEDILVRRAARWLRHDPNVAMRDVASHLDISERHLSRVFRNAIGTTPKQFARIVRLSKVVAAARRSRGGWAEIALDCGYADQSHLVNEFSAMVGTSPAALLRMTSLRIRCDEPVSPRESDFYNTFLSELPNLA
ncbi:MAG TPA: AraC family transcriptional regulator [Stellaceae bacterium]|nr:AraC family transcriptional regulator [Stellaceae bacterium]